MKRIIGLYFNGAVWVARFPAGTKLDGHERTIEELFGSRDVCTPFTVAMPVERMLLEMRERNPEFEVEVLARMGL